MTEPILDPEHRDLEQGLVRAGRDVRMSPELRDKILAALAAGAVGMTAAASAKAGSLGWLSTKGGALSAAGLVGAIGVAGTVILTGGLSEQRADGRSPPAETKASVSAASSSGSAATSERSVDTGSITIPAEPLAKPDIPPPALEPAHPGIGAAKQHPVERSGSAEESPDGPSSLREELSHIARVETALEAGNPGQALSQVSEYHRRFARPQLGLEAEVLTIQALYESGSVAAARKRAARFLQKYPKSPLGVRAKQYLK